MLKNKLFTLLLLLSLPLLCVTRTLLDLAASSLLTAPVTQYYLQSADWGTLQEDLSGYSDTLLDGNWTDDAADIVILTLMNVDKYSLWITDRPVYRAGVQDVEQFVEDFPTTFTSGLPDGILSGNLEGLGEVEIPLTLCCPNATIEDGVLQVTYIGRLIPVSTTSSTTTGQVDRTLQSGLGDGTFQQFNGTLSLTNVELFISLPASPGQETGPYDGKQ
jgi:hypothetical protein